MKPKVKICGITNLADARYCAAAGADFLGYIQYPPSPRYIPAEVAREIRSWVYGAKSVGVFVDEDLGTVNAAAASAGFDYVQLHGEESPAYCANVERPVIKSFRVMEAMSAEALRRRLLAYRDAADYFLLDAYHPALQGGTGKTFDWDLACAIAREIPIFLAGGLGPSNVNDAIRQVRPWAIDLSSRLESSPGKKDAALVEALFQARDEA